MVELTESLQKLAIDGSGAGLNGTGAEELEELRAEINRLSDNIYEVQELRHASASSSSASSTLLDRVADLDASMTTLESRMTRVGHTKEIDGSPEVSGVLDDWTGLQREYESLQGEMREDGWLMRFRSTADQAEAMMAPLKASLTSCLRYVESITSSPVPVPIESELEELPSIRKLQDLARSHEAMKSTYVPSISKILRMMDRSMAERSSKNGEALRRHSDMSRQWADLQRQLQQLDARIRIVLSQLASQSPNDNVEVLTETVSPSASDYFARGSAQKLSAVDMRKTIQHRTSISSAVSGVSGTSAASMQRRVVGVQSRATSQTPEATDKTLSILRKRTSMMSGMSSSTVRTSDRGTPPVTSRPLPDSTMKTPNTKRFTGAGPRSGAMSPSPVLGSASRLPVLSPTGPSPRHLEVPGSTPRGIGLPDPNWPKPVYGGYGRRPGPPSLGGRSVSSSAPRGGPPSSFRSMTPTPAGRSSSRMSMGSQAASMYAPPSLQPFQPSKYDLLDQHVQSVIEETHFQLFVARVDPSMKRGQRRAENEEWKGDFVFGAGQKISPVKLLKLAGRPGRFGFAQGSPRMKCLVKVKGEWQELAAVLRLRQEEEPAFGADSP